MVGLKTKEAIAEFRKAVKHGGSLPCFTRDNLVLMMAEFDRLERLANAPVSAVASGGIKSLSEHVVRPGTREAMLDFFDEGYSYTTTRRVELGVIRSLWTARHNGERIGSGVASSSAEAVNQVLDAFQKHHAKPKTTTEPVQRELISYKGGDHWTGKRRVYSHKYSVQPSVLTPGEYIWVVRSMSDRFLGSGQESSFTAAANAAGKKISALVDEEDAEKYPVPF